MHSTASRSPWARRVAGVVLLVAALAMAGCQTIGYYSHAALGQWRVLSARQPVTQVLSALDGRADAQSRRLREQLTLSQEVLDFAETDLGLEVGRRYRTYVDLKRPAVVWNVFAAPPLSLAPRSWCYPIVGCAPYRGYFDEALARRRAAGLEAEDLETYVAPVPAYSTLGWFADPLMSSFIGWPEPDLAELLLHELAHGAVWVPGDVAFNESFATFVGRRGLSEWLERQGRLDLLEERRESALARWRLLELLERTRVQLAAVYDGAADREHKLEAKARIFSALDACYVTHRGRLGGGRFDTLMDGLNNARLVSIATYEDQVPAFARLFDEAGGRWPAFFERVRALADLDDPARRRALLGSGNEQVADAGDDAGAHEIQCESLARHLLDGETSG